jgi:hypothetical protein
MLCDFENIKAPGGWTGAQAKLWFVFAAVILTCYRLGVQNFCHCGASYRVQIVWGEVTCAVVALYTYIHTSQFHESLLVQKVLRGDRQTDMNIWDGWSICRN